MTEAQATQLLARLAEIQSVLTWCAVWLFVLAALKDMRGKP